MSTSDLKSTILQEATRSQNVHHAAEALRIATQSTHHQVHNQQHVQQIDKEQGNNGHEFSEYDLKSRDSKYKRWSPKMDQFLIKLLSDVVHSYPKGAEAEMTKKAWAYVTGQLRAANPETVYSTYTKYSCQQHLFNVNHHRFKIWYILMLHLKNNQTTDGYSYRWNPDGGRFQIIDNTNGGIIQDERQVKSLLYSDSMSLPSLSSFNKGNLIVTDFFLTDHLGYMSTYHNEVLPLLIRLDNRYADGLGDLYHEIPKFEYRDSNKEYFKPLVQAKSIKLGTNDASKPKKRTHSESNQSHNSQGDVPLFTNSLSSMQHDPEVGDEDTVDPALKRSRNINTPETNSNATTTEFENALATAAIAAINTPSVTNGRDIQPIYIKDRKWFNRLVSLNESGLITPNEVLVVCEGVRDGKIPLFMLNILDQSYYPTRSAEDITPDETPDEEAAKKIREFMLPMTFNS